MQKKLYIFFLICLSCYRLSMAIEKDAVPLVPTPEHGIIAKEVASILSNYSYKHIRLDDSISHIIFDNLIHSLDPEKSYLLKEDLNQLIAFRDSLSDAFSRGEMRIPFMFYNIYKQRYLERINFALNISRSTQNFNIKEYFQSNRKNLDWFNDRKESDDYWRKRVKLDLLTLKSINGNLTAEEDSEDRNKLSNRYSNLISQARKLNSNDAFQTIMKALTDAVDPHTSYFNPAYAQAFNEGLANTFEGIGARLTVDNEIVTIQEIITGGPIFREKSIHINDRIVAVAQGSDGDFEDIIGWRLDAAISKLKGPKGTLVRLKIIPAGQSLNTNPNIIAITRDKIVVEDESAKKEILQVNGKDGTQYRVGIIKIPKFYMDFAAFQRNEPDYKSTSRDVKLLLDTLKQQQVDAILVDLRLNGGGSLPEAIELTGLFIDRGPVVQLRNVQNNITIGEDEKPGVSWSGPLGVLVNRFSASASEIFSAAIQNYGRGIVLGSQSYGKGTVQTGFPMSRIFSQEAQSALDLLPKNKLDSNNLPNKYGQINLTLSKFYRIDGNSTQLKGVMPDILFPSEFNELEYGESAQKSALPWDTIASSNYQKLDNLKPIISQLNLLHAMRMKHSYSYRNMLRETNQKKHGEVEKISLLKSQFAKTQEKKAAQLRKRINTLLKAEGKPLWKKGQPQPKLESDFIKIESAQIMGDFTAHLKEKN